MLLLFYSYYFLFPTYYCTVLDSPLLEILHNHSHSHHPTPFFLSFSFLPPYSTLTQRFTRQVESSESTAENVELLISFHSPRIAVVAKDDSLQPTSRSTRLGTFRNLDPPAPPSRSTSTRNSQILRSQSSKTKHDEFFEHLIS